MFRFSLGLFILAVAVSVLVRLIDFQRIEPKEIIDLQDASEKRLENEFDKIAPPPPTVSGITAQEGAGVEGLTGASTGTVDALEGDFDGEQGADDAEETN